MSHVFRNDPSRNYTNIPVLYKRNQQKYKAVQGIIIPALNINKLIGYFFKMQIYFYPRFILIIKTLLDYKKTSYPNLFELLKFRIQPFFFKV